MTFLRYCCLKCQKLKFNLVISFLYCITYLLNPWCRVLLEKLTGFQLVKKLPAFHVTRRFITALTKRPPLVPVLGQPNPVHIPTSHLLEIHPNIVHPSTPRSPQWPLSFRFPHQDPIRPPLLTHTRHMPSPLWSVYLLIMLDTLLLRPSLQCTTLHYTTLVDTSLPFKLHPTTLHYPLIWLNPISVSCRSISPHITTLHRTFRWFSPYFCSFRFTLFIIAFPIVTFRNFSEAPTSEPRRRVVLVMAGHSNRRPVQTNEVSKLSCVSPQPFLTLDICKAAGLWSCSDCVLDSFYTITLRNFVVPTRSVW